MRQQLRLRVLLPVAVLGLLGAGFGAYATGRPPEERVPGPAPVTTTAAEEAAPGKRKGVAPKEWARGMEALCVEADAEVGHTVAELRTADDAEAFLVAAVDVHRWLAPEVAELGWPKGEKRAVASLRADLDRGEHMASRALEALESDDAATGESLVAKAERIDLRVRRALRRLGAEECLVRPKARAAKAEKRRSAPPASTALARALTRYRVAVVVFYNAKGDVDNAAIREARAAAVEMRAGFVALDAEAGGTAAELAQDYEVFAAPAVLVLRPGPRVKTRFDGYADRETVAQAIDNARA
ncbi:MAG TPA: hypothetical protein VHF23_01700 [Gaiellaceae bacterium]|nr:hypothetical protein [Gaiellaceae bacterium]